MATNFEVPEIIKEHPIATVAGVVIGGALLYMAMRQQPTQAASYGYGGVNPQLAAGYLQLEATQLGYQAQANQTQAQEQYGVDLATIQNQGSLATAKYGYNATLAHIQAQVTESNNTLQAAIAQNTANNQTEQAAIAAQVSENATNNSTQTQIAQTAAAEQESIAATQATVSNEQTQASEYLGALQSQVEALVSNNQTELGIAQSNNYTQLGITQANDFANVAINQANDALRSSEASTAGGLLGGIIGAFL